MFPFYNEEIFSSKSKMMLLEKIGKLAFTSLSYCL